MQPSATRHSSRTRTSGARALASLAVTLGALSWSQPNVDGSDLWWHLAAGRSIAQQGEIPRTDSFSHTAAGRAWSSHSWLWDRVSWAAYDAHPDLVAWLNLALVAALFALTARNALRASGSWLAAGAATWASAACCHWFLDVRPHLLTLLLSALLLASLGARRAVWLWPPLFALWANLHGGFAFGLGVLGLHALLQSERALRRGEPLPRSLWARLIAAALAVGLNPWGFAIYAIPFEHIYHGSPFAALNEWRPLAWSLDPSSYAGRFAWLLAATVLGAALGRGQRLPLALACITAAMAISARRFVPLFAICAAPLVAVGLAALFDTIWRRLRARGAPQLSWIGSGAALCAALALWSGVDFLPRPLQRWTSGESYPSGAVAYLAAMPDPPQRLFNYYSWGGYLMLHAPRVPVFIDTRASTLYADEIAADYFAMLDAEGDWAQKLEAYAVDAVLVPTHSRIAAALRARQPAWRVAHVDPRSTLLFPPANGERRELAAPSSLLPAGADLELSRGFRLRQRGALEAAKRALLGAQRADPLQIFAYGELMFVAALQRDAASVEHWIDAALRAYPRRANPIWSFAEQAWGALGRCEERRAALQRIRLGSPFLADSARDEVRAALRDLDCSAVR